ncbi:MAG: hypothetical protein L3K08_09085, partial [Thermoplasmata archaeon]|nr:hypothetical protein [Thermoplasmata archaeon]
MRTPSISLAILLVVLLLVPTAATGAPPTRLHPGGERSTGSIALASPVPLAVRTPWAARAGYDPSYAAESERATPSTGSVRVHLTLAPSSLGLFRAPMPGAVPLTLAQIADQFGRSPAEYAAIQSYFSGEGLSVSDLDPARLSLTVGGPAGSVERAFGT